MMYYVGQVLHRMEENDSVVLVGVDIDDVGFMKSMKVITADEEVVDADPINISPYFKENEGVHKRRMFFGDICPKIFGAVELDLDSEPEIKGYISKYIKSLDVSSFSIRNFKKNK